MLVRGNLNKMESNLGSSVRYSLVLGGESIALNPLIGNSLSIHYTGEINCIHCGRKTRKSFNQGYCYPCFTRLAQCDTCIVKPERCHFAAGTCREPEWGLSHCMQPHMVYLANSSDIKVGITRQTQIPTRWIDQGAVEALPVLKVASRYLAGLIEVVFKRHVSDRTSWQKMLKYRAEPADLVAKRDALMDRCKKEIDAIASNFEPGAVVFMEGATPLQIDYPVLQYPQKVSAMNLEKTPDIRGTLLGIKGQYLIFDCGVINIRKYGGYLIEMEAGPRPF